MGDASRAASHRFSSLSTRLVPRATTEFLRDRDAKSRDSASAELRKRKRSGKSKWRSAFACDSECTRETVFARARNSWRETERSVSRSSLMKLSLGKFKQRVMHVPLPPASGEPLVPWSNLSRKCANAIRPTAVSDLSLFNGAIR